MELLGSRRPSEATTRGFVFPVRAAEDGHARGDTANKRLGKLLGELKIDIQLMLHELRHSVGTFAIARRWPQEVRRRMLNQKSGDALERVYVHYQHDDGLEPKRKCIESGNRR